MGMFDFGDYKNRLKKVLEKQATDKSKDPAERSSKKPAESNLEKQLAAQRAKASSTPQYEEARQARLKRQAGTRAAAPAKNTAPATKPKAPPPFFSEEPPRKSKIYSRSDELPEVGVTARKRAMPISDVPAKAAAKPKAAKKAAFRPESKEDFMAGLGEDNAVTKFLRKKEMEDSISKGAFKKGGKVDGCATKGKTRGRYI
jgi:hypothetical protein